MQIPLFPLNTVLFPQGPLPLRIFEPRYIDMVSRCMKEAMPFGVLLIREGHEAGAATVHEVGTLAEIIDWYQGSDGLLGITAVGGQRFRLIASERQSDGLNIGEIEALPPEPEMPLPTRHASMLPILEHVLDDLGKLYASLERRPDDAVWVSYRLMEILPLDLAQKQTSLASSDTLARLRQVERFLASQAPA